MNFQHISKSFVMYTWANARLLEKQRTRKMQERRHLKYFPPNSLSAFLSATSLERLNDLDDEAARLSLHRWKSWIFPRFMSSSNIHCMIINWLSWMLGCKVVKFDKLFHHWKCLNIARGTTDPGYWVLSLYLEFNSLHWLKIQSPSGSTCSCYKFGQHKVPLALSHCLELPYC